MGVVRRYIDFLIILLIPIYSTCISSFLQRHPYFFVHFLSVYIAIVSHKALSYKTIYIYIYHKTSI